MKTTALILTLAAAMAATVPPPAAAASPTPVARGRAPATPMAEGVIRRIEPAFGRAVIAHGPLPNGMPAMTMQFRFAKGVPVDGLKEGNRIRFAIDDANGVLTITRIEPVR